MTPGPTTPADRAAAVLRAAEAAAAAGAPAPAPEPVRLDGSADGLLRTADALAGQVDDARARLRDLEAALARLPR